MLEIKEMELFKEKKEKEEKKLPEYVNKPIFLYTGKVVLGLIATTAATATYTMCPNETNSIILTGALGLTLSAMVLAASSEEPKDEVKTK